MTVCAYPAFARRFAVAVTSRTVDRAGVLLRRHVALLVVCRRADRRADPGRAVASRSSPVRCSERPAARPGGWASSGRRAWPTASSGRRPTGWGRFAGRSRGRPTMSSSPARSLSPAGRPDDAGREFALTAMRAAFSDGLDLGAPEAVAEVARRASWDADEVAHAVATPEIKDALRATTDEAIGLGVVGVPTVLVADHLFWGDDQLAAAAGAVASAAALDARRCPSPRLRKDGGVPPALASAPTQLSPAAAPSRAIRASCSRCRCRARARRCS